MEKRFNYEGYKLIVQCRESDLLEYLSRQIPDIYGKDKCIITKDYIFAQGELPILLCAHMDTIFAEEAPPKTILYDREQGLIWSPEGIGGDDRNGVYSILYILSKLKGGKLPSVLFTTLEEKGCQGSKKASKELKGKVNTKENPINFAIQIDRHGADDAVFYNCTNKDFIKYITGFGYKEVHGSYTDICEICPEWGMAGVNFSCGYACEHTKHEVVSVNCMFNTIDMIMKIIEDVPNSKSFAYKGKASTKYGSATGSHYSTNYGKYADDYLFGQSAEKTGTGVNPTLSDGKILQLIFGDAYTKA